MERGAERVDLKIIFYDALHIFSGRIVRTILALLLSILLARSLGPHDRGLYALPATVYTGLLLSAFTGMIQAVPYFMLNANAGRGVLRPALLTGAVLTIGGSLPIVAMAEIGHNTWAIVPSVLLLIANVPPYIILGYAVGTRRIRWQSAYLALSTGALLAVMSVVLLLLSRTAWAAVISYTAVSLLIGAVCLTILVKDAAALPDAKVPFAGFLFFTLRAGLTNLVTQLNYRGDLYVVALLTTPAVLGLYTVAVSAADTLFIVTQVPAVVTSPHVGAMECARAAVFTAKCVRGTLLTSLAIAIAAAAIAPYGVSLLYGQAYMPIVPAVRLLMVGVVVLSLAAPISNYFTLKLGRPEITLASASCAAVACISVSFYLVPRFGIVGAATATAVAYALGQSVAIAFFVRQSGISLFNVLIPAPGEIRTYAKLGKALLRERMGSL